MHKGMYKALPPPWQGFKVRRARQEERPRKRRARLWASLPSVRGDGIPSGDRKPDPRRRARGQPIQMKGSETWVLRSGVRHWGHRPERSEVLWQDGHCHSHQAVGSREKRLVTVNPSSATNELRTVISSAVVSSGWEVWFDVTRYPWGDHLTLKGDGGLTLTHAFRERQYLMSDCVAGRPRTVSLEAARSPRWSSPQVRSLQSRPAASRQTTGANLAVKCRRTGGWLTIR
jgi:hypothetical protein